MTTKQTTRTVRFAARPDVVIRVTEEMDHEKRETMTKVFVENIWHQEVLRAWLRTPYGETRDEDWEQKLIAQALLVDAQQMQ